MSIKDDLLKKIEEKASRIREKRIEAANNKTLEAFVFEFFKHAEQARFLHKNERYDEDMLKSAITSLREKLKSIDTKVKVSIEFNRTDGQEKSLRDTIRGVTIYWSPLYIARQGCHQSLYIDVADLLFF